MLPNICIAGKMGAGKTTVAKYLEEKYGYKRTSLAEPMRQIVKEFFSLEDKSDPRYRRLMQKLGTDWFRSEDKEVWIRHLLKRCEGAGWVVDDVRFMNEAKILMKNGWILLFVESQDHVRYDRLVKRGDSFDVDMLKHASEAEVDLIRQRIVDGIWKTPQSCIWLGNHYNLDGLYGLVDSVMERLRINHAECEES